MATRKKPAKRPAKKTAAKKTSNSKVEDARRAAVEKRLERDSLAAQSQAERERRPGLRQIGDPVRYPSSGSEGPREADRINANYPLRGRNAPDINTPPLPDRPAKSNKPAVKGRMPINPLSAGESTDATRPAGILGLLSLEGPRNPLSDPSLYGVSNKDRAAKITALMQAQQDQATQATKKTGDAVFMGQKKIKIRSTGPRRFDDENPDGTTTEAGPDDVVTKQELLSWLADEQKVAEIKRVANQAGIAVDTYDDIAKLWGSVVNMAASSYSFAGKKVTPWSIIQLRGKYMDASGKPQDKITTSTSIDEMAPEQARLMFERTASDMLGRSATKAEIDDFIAKAQTIARQNPAKTTTTSRVGFDGEIETEGQSSVTTGGAEVVNAKAQVAAMDAAKQSEDYAAYQAAGNYFPMLFEALNSPV